jgi:ABC-type multidrug transport system ATPase subunit
MVLKSSLMRTISTLQNPIQGTIEFDGINVLEDQMGLRKILGYLPKSLEYPNMSAEKLWIILHS